MKKLKPELALFILTFFTYCYFIQDSNANINTRLDLTWSIVDYKTFSIDAYHPNTDDKAFRNGHFYCDKAPGVSLLGVPVYFAVKPFLLAFGYNDWDLRRISAYFIRVFTVSFLSALLCVFLFRMLSTINSSMKNEAFLLALVYALGTLAFPYSTLFYSHQTAAAFSFFAFYLLHHKNKTHQRLFFSGFLASLSFVTEYTCFVTMLLLALYITFTSKRKKYVLFFIAGCILPIAILAYYHAVCFGSPFVTGYSFEIKKVYAERMSKGLLGVTFPRWEAFSGILFSPRGLFTLSPFLFFAFPGFIQGLRAEKFKLFKPEIIFCLAVACCFIYINSSYNLWFGGWGIGPRFLIPALPYFMAGCFIFYACSSAVMRKLFSLAAICSCIVISLCTFVYPQVPENIHNPLTGFILPYFLQGRVAFNLGRYLNLRGTASLLPLAVFIFVVGAVTTSFNFQRRR